MGGDAEANVAHYALHELHLLPAVMARLREEEPRHYAFIVASIEVRVEDEKKKQKEIERKSKR